MSLQQQEPPRSFAADEQRACPECGNRMRLTRRTPHLILGATYERQTFTCRMCSFRIERNADAQGNPLPAGSNAGATS
jgi:DNA-directed RNA polymerase subunit RPC12/RpoP